MSEKSNLSYVYDIYGDYYPILAQRKSNDWFLCDMQHWTEMG